MNRTWGVYVPVVMCNPQGKLVRQRRGQSQGLSQYPDSLDIWNEQQCNIADVSGENANGKSSGPWG